MCVSWEEPSTVEYLGRHHNNPGHFLNTQVPEPHPITAYSGLKMGLEICNFIGSSQRF